MFYCLLLQQFVCVFKLGEISSLMWISESKKLQYVRIRDGWILVMGEYWEMSRQSWKHVNGHLCREF
jgi:hypothetical protein